MSHRAVRDARIEPKALVWAPRPSGRLTKSRSAFATRLVTCNRGRFGPMHLSGHYANHSPAFTGVLEAFPRGIAEQIGRSGRPPEAPMPFRLGNGVVQRAAVEAFVRAARPMSVGEAHTAVEELLGRSVSRNSINSCLSTGARAARLQSERVARDRYVNGGVAPTVLQGRQGGHEANPLLSPREGIRAESARRPGMRGTPGQCAGDSVENRCATRERPPMNVGAFGESLAAMAMSELRKGAGHAGDRAPSG